MAGAAIAVASALVACSSASSGRPSGGGPNPIVADSRLVQTFELAHGAIVGRPPETHFPHAVNPATRAYHYTLAEGLVDVESADPLLWQNTGLIRTQARWLTAKAAYTRITVAHELRPAGALGHGTLAWVVFYRVGLVSGCVTGWRLYIDPLLMPGQDSGYTGPRYIVTTPAKSGCDGEARTQSLLALPHWSASWWQVGRSGASKIRFKSECSTVPRVVKIRRGNEERVQLILAISDSGCPSADEPRTITVASAPGTRLVHGPTGAMPARRVPLR